jgi:imidazolonepropionase-like amidohydrolase/Tol biopolymer transport system component
VFADHFAVRSRTVAALILVIFAGAAPAAQSQAPPTDATTTLPLKPERTVRFTTDEGTWISLDVSPDGKTIVFDLLGDIYTIPMSGGKATRLTSGLAFDGQPRYSPDGKAIVFVSDRDGNENVWLYDVASTKLRKLTKGDNGQFVSPEWTPDGKYIVVTREPRSATGSDYQLWLYHIDGGNGLRISTPESSAKMYLGAAFGNDPRYIYLATRNSAGLPYSLTNFPNWMVSTFDRETGTLSQKIGGYGGAMRPTVSPDGRYVVYALRYDTATALKVRNLKTGDDRWLVSHAQRDDQESVPARDLMPGMSFTPEGKELVYFNGGKLWRTDVVSGSTAPIPFSVDVELEVGPKLGFKYPVNDTIVQVHQIRDAKLSPDKRRVAFVALDRLYIADLPSPPAEGAKATIASARRLTDAQVGEFAPDWSPDGKWIAYVTWSDKDATKGGDIYRVSADTRANPEKLSRATAHYQSVAYTPDGARLVAVRSEWQREFDGTGGDNDLVWLPSGGGDAKVITTVGNATPHFRRDDDEHIYFADYSGLHSIRFDGTDKRTVVKAAAGAEMTLSPDGRHVVALDHNNAYVFEVPMAGAAQTISLTGGASIPVRRVSKPGAEFPAWSPDGTQISFALGRSLFVYDLARGASTPIDSAWRTTSRYDLQIEVPADRPKGVIALRGGRIITMKGKEIIPSGTIVVTNNRITAVGAAGKVAIPSGAKVIDVKGKTIMPGLVDIHWHGVPSSNIHETNASNYLASLAFGVTTIRDPSTATDVFTYADRAAAGDMIAPRIYSTGTALTEDFQVTSFEQARDLVQRYSEFYDSKTLKQYNLGGRKVRQWIAIAAREQGLLATNEGYAQFRKTLTEAIDGFPGHEHSLTVSPLFGDVTKLFAETGITITPTLISSSGYPAGEVYWAEQPEAHDNAKLRRFVPHYEIDRRTLRRNEWYRDDQHSFKRKAVELAKIVATGGRVGIGGHGQFPGIMSQWELWMIQSGGMPRHDALRVGTIFGAEAIGLGDDLGSLEVGKLADLLVLDANPLDDIKNTSAIRYVMKNGRLYDGATLDERWPREKPLEPLWWWKLDPGRLGDSGQR